MTARDILSINKIYYIVVQRDREKPPTDEFNNTRTHYTEGFYSTEGLAITKLQSVVERLETICGEKWTKDNDYGYSYNNMHVYINRKLLNDDNEILSVALGRIPYIPIPKEKLLKTPIKPNSKVYVVSLDELPRGVIFYEDQEDKGRHYMPNGTGMVRGVFTQKIKAEKFALKFRKDYGGKDYWIEKDINKWDNGEIGDIRLYIMERNVDEV